MSTIGETLRRERVRQGLDLHEISRNTKIGTRMLQAMEAGEFGKLPGGVFTRSFVKQYASVLGLDAAYVEAELGQLHPEGEDKTRVIGRQVDRPAEPETRSLFTESSVEPKSLFSSLVWVGVAVLVCGGIYFVMERPKSNEPAIVTAPVEKTRPVAKSAAPKVDAPAKPLEVTTPSIDAIGSGPLQMYLSATEPSWVSISVDGKAKFAGVLKANEKREIRAIERVKVVTGNAGGLGITLGGKTLESIGRRGQIRTVDVTQAGAQVGSRTLNPVALP